MNATEAARFTEANPDASRQAQDLIRGVITKASSDADFRAKLTTDARAALAEYTGRDVSEAFTVRFVEPGTFVADADREATVVLPSAEAELSEEELEAVAGGTDVAFWAGVGIVLAGATLVKAFM